MVSQKSTDGMNNQEPVCVSDCRSLVDYVNSNETAKTQDKRLGIELDQMGLQK